MGTNYYAVRTRPTVERPIHIGKASIGWKFNFEAHNDVYNEPPVVWNTYNQVIRWLHDHVVLNKEYVILDEYDDVVSFDVFKEIVEEKQVSGSFTYAEGGVHWIDSVEHADFPDDQVLIGIEITDRDLITKYGVEAKWKSRQTTFVFGQCVNSTDDAKTVKMMTALINKAFENQT